MMTVKYIRECLERIESVGDGDPQVAHSLEDYLAWSVIGSIADNPLGAQELCREALKSLDIGFPRWCA